MRPAPNTYRYSYGQCACGHPIDSSGTLCGSEQHDHLCPSTPVREFIHAGETYRHTARPSRYTDERTLETLYDIPAQNSAGHPVIVTLTELEARRTWSQKV